MTESEKFLVKMIILVCIISISTMALVSVISITSNKSHMDNLIEAIYDYDYQPNITQTNEIEVK